MIFIKRSKVVVDCLTSNESAMEYFPIAPTKKFLPEWWKQCPSKYIAGFSDVATIKKCNGIHDHFDQGFILPLWSDLNFNVRGDVFEWQFSDRQSIIEPHTPEQWKYFADPAKFGHMKLISPWHLKTKANIKFLFLNPAWHLPIEKPFEILSATVSFKFQHATNINLMLSLMQDTVVNLKAGQPMAHIVPITEKEIILKHHLVDESDLPQVTQFSFTNLYQKRKAHQIAKEKSCPFSFLKGNNS